MKLFIRPYTVGSNERANEHGHSDTFNSLAHPLSTMPVTLRQPTVRRCERCNRKEHWNETTESWCIADESPGSIYCLHEWDINGTFVPFES